jgi:hypothetical protein
MSKVEIIRKCKKKNPYNNRFYIEFIPCGEIKINSRNGKELEIKFRGSHAQAQEVMRIYEFFIRLLEFSGNYRISNNRKDLKKGVRNDVLPEL